MVQAVVDLSDYSNRVLNIVKAKLDFKRKDEALNYIVKEYGEELLEPELRPEYVQTALKIQKQEVVRVGSVENLRKRYEQ